MPNLPVAIASIQERFPRTSRLLYQLFLMIFTFICMISLARYDHNPAGSPPFFLSPAHMNDTFEHLCTITAREADVPVGPLRFIIPHFMLCPTTLTFIGTCIAFTLGIIKLRSFNPGADFGAPTFVVILLFNIEWGKGVLVSLQMLIPMYTWTFVFATTLLHPLMMLVPGYRRYHEQKTMAKAQKDEVANTRVDADLEAGEPRNESEGTPLLPLTGTGFTRNTDGAYVENPSGRARLHDLFDEMRR